jgi:hypothetical protein
MSIEEIKKVAAQVLPEGHEDDGQRDFKNKPQREGSHGGRKRHKYDGRRRNKHESWNGF